MSARRTRHLAGAVALIAMALALALALALPSGASAGRDRRGNNWVPGSVLIKFGTPDRGKIDALLRSIGGHVVAPLPIIPNAYEIHVTGNVSTAIHHAFVVSEERGPSGPRVEWAQPNYIEHYQYFATPKEKAYYPNDPQFWPFASTNPNGCQGKQAALGQAALWPWYGDLANSNGPWNKADANPLPSSERLPDTAKYDVGLSGAASSSIDVLPVWNALAESLDGKHTTGPTGDQAGKPVWSSTDLQRSGIAVWDTGLSDAPDLIKQVAALYSVARRPSTPHTESGQPEERFNVVYADNVARQLEEDRAIRGELHDVRPNLASRTELLPIDDLGSGPLGSKDELPDGCDGHGTEVASVAAASAGNGEGIAGVGWNVPLVGIRPGVPVLDDAHRIGRYHNDLKAILDAADSAPPLEVTDQTMIDALGIVRALRLPVLNMSWGSQLFSTEHVHGDNAVVAKSPAVLEAMERVLLDGTTLGVAAAGPGKYGFGSSGFGAVTSPGATDAAQAPCAMRALGDYHVDVVRLGPVPFAPFDRAAFRHLNLICVTGTFPDSSQLIPDAGRGDTAVELAAPGVATVASRPIGPNPTKPIGAYRLAYGTSFAAAMVSGAAALLREVAEEAPMRIIAQALRAGARSRVGLARNVRYGQLDVACSALWLVQRADHGGLAEKWKVRVAVGKLEGATTKHCFHPSVSYGEETWTLPKSEFAPGSMTEPDDGLSKPGVRRRADSGQQLIENAFEKADSVKDAREIQNFVLNPPSEPGLSPRFPHLSTAFFPIAPGLPLEHPQLPPDRPIYNFQGRRVFCPGNSRLTAFRLRWNNSIHPQGYIWFSPRNSLSASTFMVALIKPWYWDTPFLPDTMKIAVTVQCVRPPPDQEP